MRTLLICLVAFLAAAALARPPVESDVLFKDSTAITCWNQSFKDFRTRQAESRLLISSNKTLRAYARTTAEAKGTDERGTEQCTNNSSLLVSHRNAQFKEVFVRPPSEDLGGNGIILVDWSADSRYLLAQVISFPYYSDYWEHSLVIYSAENGQVKELELNALISAEAPMCGVDGQAVGFSSDGHVLFLVVPNEMNGCVDEPTYFAIDWQNGTAKQLYHKPKVRIHASWGRR